MWVFGERGLSSIGVSVFLLRVPSPCSFSVFLLRVPSPCSFSVFLLRTIAPLWFLLDLLDAPRVLIVVSIIWPVIVRISDFAQQETSPLVTGPAEYKLVGESISLLYYNNRPSYQDRYGWSFQHRTRQTLGGWWYRKKFPSGFQTANTHRSRQQRTLFMCGLGGGRHTLAADNL